MEGGTAARDEQGVDHKEGRSMRVVGDEERWEFAVANRGGRPILRAAAQSTHFTTVLPKMSFFFRKINK